jgi:hypothetical protein
MSHVPDGLEMAKRNRLPRRVRDFIAEHHGDRVIQVFYQKAKDMAEEGEVVDINRFKYPGPRPQSRESGIVQLADSIEAASSAMRPNTEEAIEKLVNKLVDDHLAEGQLDSSGLTLGDIKKIRSSYIETLQGRFHTRIRYPGNEELSAGEPSEEKESPAKIVPETSESPSELPAGEDLSVQTTHVYETPVLEPEAGSTTLQVFEELAAETFQDRDKIESDDNLPEAAGAVEDDLEAEPSDKRDPQELDEPA